jgi:hypothetical protein
VRIELRMRTCGKSANCWVRVLLCTLMLAAIPVAARAHTGPDFSGLWTQENDRCQPKRSGDVTVRISISTGTDGDEFHTSVIWKDSSLVFSIEEHEDGRILQSKETWSLIEDAQRFRERANILMATSKFSIFAASDSKPWLKQRN